MSITSEVWFTLFHAMDYIVFAYCVYVCVCGFQINCPPHSIITIVSEGSRSVFHSLFPYSRVFHSLLYSMARAIGILLYIIMTVALGLVGFWSFANIIIINQPKRMGVESPVHFGRLFGPYEPIHLGPK